MFKNQILMTFAALVLSQSLIANTLSNALALFDWAENQYPDLLTPVGAQVQEIQGFYVRYYSDNDVYLGVQGDNVWALGPTLGTNPVLVGKIESLITVSTSDISNAVLTNSRSSCTYYADTLVSAVQDVQRGLSFAGNLDISVDGSDCVFISNSIPNHDFNDETASFATNVAEVAAEFRTSIEPVFADSTTALSLSYDNAILLNGVKLDLLAAGCFGVGNGAIGCNDINQPWRYDPMSPLTRFGTDRNNAHTQPDGTYHYHGNPQALFDQTGSVASPIIGFAADGFPIFGSYIEDNGSIRKVRSSFQLRSGSRPSGADDPGGSYDGSFIDDYEYIADLGDLDECNGMMREGVYGYYVVDSYPWVLACFKGIPNESFRKGGGEDGGGMTGPPAMGQ